MEYEIDFKLSDYFDLPDELVHLVVHIDYRLRVHPPEPDVGIFHRQPELDEYMVYLDNFCLRRISGRWDFTRARERFGDAIDFDELKACCLEVLNDQANELIFD